jgi:hypothetical protein
MIGADDRRSINPMLSHYLLILPPVAAIAFTLYRGRKLHRRRGRGSPLP